MAHRFLTGGHAVSDQWLICFASEFPDEGLATSTIFTIGADNATRWEQSDWANGAVASCDFLHGPGNRLALCVLSDQGVVSISNRAGILAEVIEGAGLASQNGQGYMSAITVIADELIACGDAAQLYRRLGPDRWEPVIPLLTAEEKARNRALFAGLAIGATSLPTAVNDMRGRRDFATLASGPLGEILIGGGFGLIARVTGTRYDEVRTGDRAQIVFVTQIGDEITVVGWQDASTIIYRGTFRDGLRRIATSRLPGNASTASFYEGTLYIGSKAGLFRFEGDTVLPVTEWRVQAVTKLSAVDGVLWIIGHHDVHRVDQRGIQTFQQPG